MSSRRLRAALLADYEPELRDAREKALQRIAEARSLEITGLAVIFYVHTVREAMGMQLQEVVEDQAFSPTLIAGALRTTKAEIAGTLGLSQDALSRTTRVRSPRHAGPRSSGADPGSGRPRTTRPRSPGTLP